MYSCIKNVQILVSLLKEYKIRNIVMAPGGSDIPIIHSIEVDSFFDCYSVVDERSLIYFALGISQMKGEPVACICTSGTAASNFLPGLTEAFYQDVPLIAITADKDPYLNNNLETQKIDQSNLFNSVVRKSVDLPIINNSDTYWYCSKLIQEALLELSHNGKGPVHINIPTIGNTSVYDCAKLPQIKKMEYVNVFNENEITNVIHSITKKNRILFIIGQDIVFSRKDISMIEEIFKKINCVFIVEHLSNIKCKGTLIAYPFTETSSSEQLSSLVPDLVISMGNNIASYNIKPFLSSNSKKLVHWSIDENGRVRDVFKCLTKIFECSPSDFFKLLINYLPKKAVNKLEYFNIWKNCVNQVQIPDFPYSNFYIAQELSKKIPDYSIMHLAILNSTRIFQFFDLPENVRVFSNIGALGIDGCLSTFIGQASCTKQLAFCIIGDLSFFYDMNAAGIKHISNNVRIILLNNGGGSEFHFFMGKKKIPTINDYICAEHKKSAKGWVSSLGYIYESITDKNEFQEILPDLMKPSESPIFVEIFTDMEEDAKLTKAFYSQNFQEKISAKKLANNILSTNQKKVIKKLLNRDNV